MQVFRQDLISIAITFCFGVFVGGYLYLGSFAPLLSEYGIQASNADPSWQLTGEMLGDCRNGCPSFRIENNGSYRYRHRDTETSETMIREGALPLLLAREVRQQTTALIDTLFLETSRAAVCGAPEIQTGQEYRYTLRYQGATYEFDSCALRDGGTAWSASTLQSLWKYFSDRWDS